MDELTLTQDMWLMPLVQTIEGYHAEQRAAAQKLQQGK